MAVDRITQLLQTSVAHHRAGRLPAAAVGYGQILKLRPRHFDALHLSGLIALQLGQSAQALRSLTLAHQIAPADAVCAMRLALAERAHGKLAAAEQRLRDLVARHPQMSEAWDNLGQVLKTRGALASARAAHQQATETDPANGQSWFNLGLTSCLLGEATSGLAQLDRALTADRPYRRAHYGRGVALQQLNRITEALEAYCTHLDAEPSHLPTYSARLFCRQYLDSPHPADHIDALKTWRNALPTAEDLSPRERSGGRIRVGFVSGDFRRHSVAWFMLPLLRHLNRDHFEIVLYHEHGVVDEISQELAGLASAWRQTVALSEPAFVAQVRQDQLDIAVDLSGHTGGNRLGAFARRLAPTQITYLGYPDTTGVPAMDFRFVDGVTDPDDEATVEASEELVRFSSTLWAYAPPTEAPLPQAGPATRGGPVTFGSFNNFAKVSPATIRLWAEVLFDLPEARLVLKGGGIDHAAVHAAFSAHGIAPSRIFIFARTASTAEHLAAYNEIDIALDPLPYHGTTTTCEALWMNRPVITLRGGRHANRVGPSLLQTIGHSGWIAQTPTAYRSLARELAAQAPTWHEHPLDLRAALRASPLLDHAGQAERFGAALRTCHARRQPVALGADG